MVKKTASGLIIPGTITNDSFPFLCRVCGARFRAPTVYERHVIQCAETNEAELRARSIRERAPFMNKEFWDAEHEDWVEANRKDLLSGKKKM